MSFLAWIILGLIAGFIGSRIVNSTGQGLIVDIALGIVGAVVGGFLFHQFGEPGVSGLNLYSLLVATVGAVVVLWLYHALVAAGSSDPPPVPSDIQESPMPTISEATPVAPGRQPASIRPIPDECRRARRGVRTMMLNSVSWSAVFAGATVGSSPRFILNMLGLGIGLSTVDPLGDGTPAASSLGIGAGLWFVLSGILAAGAGGYFAGRLSGKPSPAMAVITACSPGQSRPSSSCTCCRRQPAASSVAPSARPPRPSAGSATR